MTRRIVVKVTGAVVAVVVGLLVVGWLAFVPSPKEPPYAFVAAWGGKGDGPGQFNDPTGVAVAGDEVFVADARNGRIQVFDLDGNFKRQFGRPGTGPGELSRPMNITVAGDELYVAEYWNDRIQVFGLDGIHRRFMGRKGSGPGAFNAPGGIAVSPAGDLFVADFYNQRVQRLKADGSFVGQWGTTGEIGIGAGSFNYPTDVAIGSDGTLYVADGYNDRIQAFAADGRLLRKWGGPFARNIHGPFAGWFATVTALAVDKAGNVFAADFYNRRVQKFAADGTFLTTFGNDDAGPGHLRHAMGVAVVDDGSVFVTDFGNNRVTKWRPNGGR